MGIGPVNEVNNLLNLQNGAAAKTSGGKDESFQDTMAAAAGTVSNKNAVEAASSGYAAMQKKPEVPAPSETKNKSDDKAVAVQETGKTDTSARDNKKADDVAGKKAEKNGNDKLKEKLSDDDKAVLSEAEEKIVEETAALLGIPKEDLLALLEEMGLTAADLLKTDNVASLVTQAFAEGDLTALVADENLLGLMQDVNRMIRGLVEEFAQQQEMQPQEFADLLMQMKEDTLESPQEGLTAAEDVQIVMKPEEADGESARLQSAPEETMTEGGVSVGTEAVSQTAEDAGKGSQQQETGGDLSKHSEERMQQNAAEHMNTVSHFAPADAQAVFDTEMPTAPMADPREIIEQMTHQIRTRVTPQVTELSMQLNPENLGSVGLTVAMKEGAMTAHFTTQNEMVRAALEAQIMVLKENLEQQGVKIEAVEVTVASHGFERNLDQGDDTNRQQEEEQERLRKATRKIDLSGMLGDGDALEEIGAQEEVTVSMMQADGNRMDYKV